MRRTDLEASLPKHDNGAARYRVTIVCLQCMVPTGRDMYERLPLPIEDVELHEQACHSV